MVVWGDNLHGDYKEGTIFLLGKVTQPLPAP